MASKAQTNVTRTKFYAALLRRYSEDLPTYFSKQHSGEIFKKYYRSSIFARCRNALLDHSADPDDDERRNGIVNVWNRGDTRD